MSKDRGDLGYRNVSEGESLSLRIGKIEKELREIKWQLKYPVASGVGAGEQSLKHVIDAILTHLDLQVDGLPICRVIKKPTP